jgi:hypothetical protein
MLQITRLALLSLTLLFTLVDCASESSSSSPSSSTMVVRDTLGWRFNVACASGLCSLTPQDSNLLPTTCENGSGTETFILVPDKLLAIYAAIVPSTAGYVQLSGAEPSHPVACDVDADCLPSGTVETGATYACTNGICQCASSACDTEDHNFYTYDVLTLCQFDIAWPSLCPYVTLPAYASRINEVAALCGSKTTCDKVPADCQQLSAAVSLDAGVLASTPAESNGVESGAIDAL